MQATPVSMSKDAMQRLATGHLVAANTQDSSNSQPEEVATMMGRPKMMATQVVGISQATVKGAGIKTKSQGRKARIEIPANLVQKGSTNVRTTPVQHPKKQANHSYSGSQAASRAFGGK